MPTKIHLISDQKLRTKDNGNWKNTFFTYQVDGSEEVKKGVAATFCKQPTDNSPERDAIENALKTGHPLELDEQGEDQFGNMKFKLPRSAGGAGGGGGRPSGGYKGKAMGDDDFVQMYFRTKTRIHAANGKIYGDTLTPAQIAEIDRAEAAQFIIMVKENVFAPKESR